MMTLYDEEQIMRSYIESERHDAALEAALEASICTCQDFGASITDTIAKVIKKYKLTEEEATEKVQKYWN